MRLDQFLINSKKLILWWITSLSARIALLAWIFSIAEAIFTWFFTISFMFFVFDLLFIGSNVSAARNAIEEEPLQAWEEEKLQHLNVFSIWALFLGITGIFAIVPVFLYALILYDLKMSLNGEKEHHLTRTIIRKISFLINHNNECINEFMKRSFLLIVFWSAGIIINIPLCYIWNKLALFLRIALIVLNTSFSYLHIKHAKNISYMEEVRQMSTCTKVMFTVFPLILIISNTETAISYIGLLSMAVVGFFFYNYTKLKKLTEGEENEEVSITIED